MEGRTPSIFELSACNDLKSGLREAFRYLLENLNQYENFTRLPLPPTDETVLLLDLIIEYNYIRAYNASYAEHLFNLVRFRGVNNSKIQQVVPSVICLTVIPYLQRKLDKYFEDLNYKETRTANELRRIRIYRLLTRSGLFIDLLCMLMFAGGQSRFHNILNMIADITLKGRGPIEIEMTTFGERASKTIADLLGRMLTVGSYMVQFLDYWNTHKSSTPLFVASAKIPKPPRRDDLPYTDDSSSSICLICEHVRQNECALSNTGYVFCYSCIYRYVKSKHRCPMTGNPATVDNIVKLFTTSAPS